MIGGFGSAAASLPEPTVNVGEAFAINGLFLR